MRIRPSPGLAGRRAPLARRPKTLPHNGRELAFLWAGLVLAIVAAAVAWYGLEGHEIVGVWADGLAGPGRTAVHSLPALQLEIGAREYRRLAEVWTAASQAGGTWEENNDH